MNAASPIFFLGFLFSFVSSRPAVEDRSVLFGVYGDRDSVIYAGPWLFLDL